MRYELLHFAGYFPRVQLFFLRFSGDFYGAIH
jgi:hypothetical protein